VEGLGHLPPARQQRLADAPTVEVVRPMSVNPLGELDLELDEVLDGEVEGTWRTYRRWTVAWTCFLAPWSMAGIMTVWLILAGEPFAVGMASFAASAVPLVVTSVLGQRARRRWRTAERLRGR
jgi:hypothetical protein